MSYFLNLIWCLGSLKSFCSMTWALSVFGRRKKRNVDTSEPFARADELMMNWLTPSNVWNIHSTATTSIAQTIMTQAQDQATHKPHKHIKTMLHVIYLIYKSGMISIHV